jgi:hypothetical protein
MLPQKIIRSKNLVFALELIAFMTLWQCTEFISQIGQ